MLSTRFRQGAIGAFAATFSALLFAACAGSDKDAALRYQDPCRAMQAQVKEKRALDAEVRALEKQLARYRKAGDTASAASADHRLRGLLENQRLLKQSLEESSSACRPQWQDLPPERDPARREHLEGK